MCFLNKGPVLALVLLAAAGSGLAQDLSSRYLAAANQAYLAKNYDQAILYYQAVVKLNPNSAVADQGLGNSYYVERRYPEALSAYEAALELDPNNAQLSRLIQALKTNSASPAPTAASTTQPIGPVVDLSHPAPLKPEGHRYMGIGGGTEMPSQGCTFQSGYGIEFYVGYADAGNLSLLISVAGYEFPLKGSSLSRDEVEIVPGVRYALSGKIKPYLCAGLGMDFDISNYTGGSSTQTNFMVQGGVGLEFEFSKGTSFFIEGKYSEVFAQSAFAYIPLNAGLHFDIGS